jgi:RNA polymerase sigma-70 factor (ECF subfamily)
MNETFETSRPYLFAIAYRMLGSAMDAQDMVQETSLRYQATEPATILSLKAYLTTIISRLCVDQLHLARRKREQYLGPWLPEPIVTRDAPELVEVEKRVDRYESISLAFLVMLEQLQPLERAVFLLREVFDYDYTEIAAMLDKSEATCRQSLSRARKHLVDHRPRFEAEPELQRQLLTSFLQAIDAGEMNTLINLLAQDVTLWSESGGKVKGAAMRPVCGSRVVARFFIRKGRTFTSALPQGARVELAEANGQPALMIRVDGRTFAVLTIEVVAGRIQTLRIMANPEKLTHV